MLQKIKLLIGIKDDSKDDLINLIIELVHDEIMDFCNISNVDDVKESLVIKLVAFRYARIGTETLTSYNYSGVSETFIEGYPEDLKKSLDSLKNRSNKIKMR